MPITLTLGPAAQAQLALVALNLDAVAEQLDIETNTTYTAGHRVPPGFTPTKQLQKAVARGVAALVCGDSALPIGSEPAAAVERLQALGVSEVVAKGVVDIALGHGRLTPTAYNDDQASAAVTARLAGAGFADQF